MADEFTGKVIADKYRVDSLVRSGELGSIYRGRHLFMDKPVTLKLLSPWLAADENLRKKFSAEARNAVLVSHPNLLAASDFGSDTDGTVYIVFEGLDGDTLQHALETQGPFSVERAIDIAKQAVAGLAAVHEKGLFHGKLSPQNILLSHGVAGHDTVRLFDLGLAGANGNAHASATDKFVHYISPEQYSGTHPVDGRADIYSLGIILYQMLAGEVPFRGETPTDVVLKQTEEPPPPLSDARQDLPAGLEAVIEKALAKDPDERQQSAEEFLQELESVSMSSAASGNNIWKTAFIVLAGISILSAIFIYATSVKQTDPTTQLQPDANGQPVQPINPATGMEEQNLAAMPGMYPAYDANSNVAVPPGTLPGGDGYNPWGNGGAPPPGAPQYIAPGGQVITIDPATGSPFMPPDGVVLVPVPVNTNTATKPSPTPKSPPANANVSATPAPTATPQVRPPQPKATATPRPASARPPATNKPESGESQSPQ